MAEELGLVGVTAIIALFAVLIMRGIQIGLNAPDLYSTYLNGPVTVIGRDPCGFKVKDNNGFRMG